MSEQRDIEEQLRAWRKTMPAVWYGNSRLDAAADEIARLRAQLASARKALEPFAAIDFPEVYSDRLPILGIDRLIGGLTLEHLRAAKAALTDEIGKS